MAVLATNLGFPRIGPRRELKRALEAFWAGSATVTELEATAASLRQDRWQLQAGAGLDQVPVGDFSLYDHVLDTAVTVGAVPDRHRHLEGLARYFAMARGSDAATPLDMTKWFDTNYHYLVPELHTGQRFALSSSKLIDELAEARALGVPARPVLLGPLTFLRLARRQEGVGSWGPGNLDLLPGLRQVYAELLSQLQAAGAEWVQLDEPVLALDLDEAQRQACLDTYRELRAAAPALRLLVATYFAGLGENLRSALELPVAALHLDVVRDPGQLDPAVNRAPSSLALSVGIVDGRNVWRTDLDAALSKLEAARSLLGSERLLVAPSCSLLHLPIDLDPETGLDPELRSWLAFARQRLDEVTTLVRGLNEGRDAIAEDLAASSAAAASRAASPRVHDQAVAQRLGQWHPGLTRRAHPYGARRAAQQERLALPLLPTTTIGSFPQTSEVRSQRARYRRGDLDAATYDEAMKASIASIVAFQEEAGLDVVVHGEPERNDMVEYFGELLGGVAVTTNGWVQSYGSRCVKPPIIFGDVTRSEPMTVRWATYAQSLTKRPVKGMLTGPVTILAWSFVRNDQPIEVTARQLAFVIRDEVADLEAAGIRIIQIDEPALREGLPLHVSEWKDYLDWAVGAFRLASSGVDDSTQIHTHMCYSEFNDIIDAIAAFDADVISIEASRSNMALLQAFTDFDYPNEIGPGIWDVHSPRVPGTNEMVSLLEAALAVVPAERLWVNPDCGLKTRRWEEVRPASAHLVEAAAIVRDRLRQAGTTAGAG